MDEEQSPLLWDRLDPDLLFVSALHVPLSLQVHVLLVVFMLNNFAWFSLMFRFSLPQLHCIFLCSLPPFSPLFSAFSTYFPLPKCLLPLLLLDEYFRTCHLKASWHLQKCLFSPTPCFFYLVVYAFLSDNYCIKSNNASPLLD